MAKKKKSVSSPNTRAKEAKEVKEVKEVKEMKLDVAEQTQSSGATVAGGGTELVSARDKLSSVLRVLMDQTDESSDAPAADDDKSEVKAVIKKEKPASVAAGSTARQAKRGKRRRTLSTDSAFHHTYVMKLFDRSVDLAQFKEGTPLYPICRAWMANQPRNTNLGARKDPSSPEPPEEGAVGAAEPAEAAEPPPAEGGETPAKKVNKLPNPLPLPEDPAERKKLKVPDLIQREKVGDIDMNMEVKPSRESLLRGHQSHWVQVRKGWHATGHRNEARFVESADILREIFKRT